MKITKDKISYIESMCKELIKSLKDTQKEFETNENYIFASANRAKFKRLRVELTKELMQIQNEIC